MAEPAFLLDVPLVKWALDSLMSLVFAILVTFLSKPDMPEAYRVTLVCWSVAQLLDDVTEMLTSEKSVMPSSKTITGGRRSLRL